MQLTQAKVQAAEQHITPFIKSKCISHTLTSIPRHQYRLRYPPTPIAATATEIMEAAPAAAERGPHANALVPTATVEESQDAADVDADVDIELAMSGADGREQANPSNDYGNDADFSSGYADAAVAADAAEPILEIDQHDVSDISSNSDIDDDVIDEEYNTPVDFNNNRMVDKLDSLHHHRQPSSSSRAHMNNHDTTSSNYIRSQRENVDRLLMMSGGGIIGGPASSHQNTITFDREYYKNSGDWLRFMQRRHAVHMAERYPEMRATYPFDDYDDNGNAGYVHGSSPGYGNTTGNPINPDQYYRGFDNSRIRMGFAQPQYPHQQLHPHSYHGNRCIPPALDDEELQSEGALYSNPTNCHSHLQKDSMMPNDIRDFNIPEPSSPIPTESETNDLSLQPTLSLTPAEEGGQQQYKSTLRVGGIIFRNSDPLAVSSSVHRAHQHQQQSNMQQGAPIGMHEASCDSKYATYACCVDRSQDDRSVEIPIFTLARPHMRSFHCAWVSFFFAFLSWFAIAPLLAEVQKSLALTKEQIWTSSICSVAGAVLTRCIAGLFCDIYGARWMTATVLFICGIPTMCTGLVNTAIGLDVLRLFTGIGGSAFVTCQYWTCSTFTKEVAGTANALAAGWGNLGGGVAQIFVGSMLFPFFKWIYAETTDPAGYAWRTCCIIPGFFCIAFAYVIIRYSDDSPKGNYQKRKRLGSMQRPLAIMNFKAAMRDCNTWILLIQYGCCFGVELTMTNAAALYFKEEFEMSTEAAAAVASIFGWMDLFARALGGLLSDLSNAYRGMRGRLVAQLLCFMFEGKITYDVSYTTYCFDLNC